MIESVIMALIYLCLLAIAVYLVIWVLAEIGIVIPANIMKLLWVIVVLVAILVIVRTFLPALGIRVGAKHTELTNTAYYATYTDTEGRGKRIFCTDVAG